MFKPKRGRRPRKPLPFRHVFVISIVLFTLFTVWGLWLIDRGIKPTLKTIAKTKAQQVAMYAIDYGLGKQSVNNLKQLEPKQNNGKSGTQLIVRMPNDNSSYVFNNAEMNRILNETTVRIQHYLRLVESGRPPSDYMPSDVKIEYKNNQPNGIVYFIPLGQATKNALIANLGPKIPVKFEMVSNVNSNLETQKQQVGINNTWVQISIHVTVNVSVVIPFAIDAQKVTQDILIQSILVPGKVPDYYNGSGTGNNNLTPTVPLPSPSSGNKTTSSNKTSTTSSTKSKQ